MTGRNVIAQRCNGRGRALTFGHRRSTAVCGSSTPQRRRRRARNGRKGIGAFLNHLVGAFVPMFGVLSQELDRIGANGFMVLRLRVSC